jgi:hypothetical protein
VIEPNGVSHDRAVPVRSRRRKGAKWKSGLMLTGLGAVVLGAGYFAGVNAPAVANAGSTQTVASAGINPFGANDNGLLSPQGSNSDNGQGFLFNGDGNQGFQGDDGSLLSNGGDGSGLDNQFNQQQPPVQQFGRRSRQFGFSQQQPNFGGPVTRSRGS